MQFKMLNIHPVNSMMCGEICGKHYARYPPSPSPSASQISTGNLRSTACPRPTPSHAWIRNYTVENTTDYYRVARVIQCCHGCQDAKLSDFSVSRHFPGWNWNSHCTEMFYPVEWVARSDMPEGLLFLDFEFGRWTKFLSAQNKSPEDPIKRWLPLSDATAVENKSPNWLKFADLANVYVSLARRIGQIIDECKVTLSQVWWFLRASENVAHLVLIRDICTKTAEGQLF